MILLKRIIYFGWKNFSRNIGFSVAAVLILVMFISLLTFLYFFQNASQFLIKEVREKVDVSVYFEDEASEEEILKISKDLVAFPEIQETKYVSKDRALEKFTERHKDDPSLMESLDMLGVNPFLAYLNITALDSSHYEPLVSYLEQEKFKALISKVDYYQKKPILEKLVSISVQVNKFGIIFSIILATLALVIVFSQIQLSLNSSRREISTMRMVGASNFFIRGPFIIHGWLIGFFAGAISFLIFYFILSFSNPWIEAALPGIGLFEFFISNSFIILFIQMAIGIGLGILASSLAIKKYLKV